MYQNILCMKSIILMNNIILICYNIYIVFIEMIFQTNKKKKSNFIKRKEQNEMHRKK